MFALSLLVAGANAERPALVLPTVYKRADDQTDLQLARQNQAHFGSTMRSSVRTVSSGPSPMASGRPTTARLSRCAESQSLSRKVFAHGQ